MKTVIVLTLLIATVFCLPVKRTASSSESSEELPPPILRKAADVMFQAEPTQTAAAESNESTDSADDTEDADEESETDEKEENDTDSSESESGETATTAVPSTAEPSLDPIINTGRGDSMGYPSDYKKAIVYVDANDVEKIPSPYKSYSSDKLGGLTFVSKKTSAYDDQSINDVEKEIKLYKALQVHDTLLEDEGTSTPEVENMEPNDRQAPLGNQEVVPTDNQDATAESNSEGASAGDTSSDSASASASQEQTEEESDSSPSSEETTATPGAADSDDDSSQSTESQESNSDEETAQTTDATVIIAK
ncbi:Dentin matrix acidic phosphoprotein 1 [Labeo rohita]|uniref:Dentin matrix acidic phosphoprotein 1 n=1 Tax=Labeo rohita TaxID=84645 RepID=A0ABQ8MB19_LABRO|nr:Dentin matrix acidic phosphoprotein 1 [Labeo rohita]